VENRASPTGDLSATSGSAGPVRGLSTPGPITGDAWVAASYSSRHRGIRRGRRREEEGQMRRRVIVPPARGSYPRRLLARPARRRAAVVLVGKADRVAYQRAARLVGELTQVATVSLDDGLRAPLIHDAEDGLFQLAVILARRAEARSAAADLRRALAAADLPGDEDRQVTAIEQKIVDDTAVAEQMARELESLLRTVEVLIARRGAARFSGPVSTEVMASINHHLERIGALSDGIEQAAGLTHRERWSPSAYPRLGTG